MGERKPRPTRAEPGTVTHDGRPMKYAHAQRAAYVLDRCRCGDCTRAASEAGRELAHRIAPAYVGADPARQHIRFLADHGVGLKQIARVSGVSQGCLWKLVYGKTGHQPSKRVRKETLDRILAVMPSHAADGSRVDAAPTWALIDEMLAAGVPLVRIAEHIGQSRALQLGRDTVSPRNARAVKELHAAWVAGRVDLERRDRHGNRHVAPPPPPREPDYIDRSAVLLDLAEILEARNSETWRAEAACRNRPPWVWFPGRGDQRCIDKAKLICRSCVVRTECLSANLHQRDGIYGGLTAVERRELRRIEVGVAS